MYSSLDKFVTYNHPDQRSCMVEFYLKYDTTTVTPTTTDNGTQGLSMYFGVFHGKDASKPADGDESIGCTLFQSETSWNEGGCVVSDNSWNTKDYYSSALTSSGTYCDTITTITPCTTTIKWKRFPLRVSGKFMKAYKPKYASDSFSQCVSTWSVGGGDRTKCSWSALSTVSLGCTNDGVIADASEIKLGFMALLGSLSMF